MPDMESAFSGFSEPSENWSKLPHQFIEALPILSSESEIKVVLYVLRHTWGYGDTEKKITLNEFSTGRRRRDGSRIDNGTGQSINAIKDGLRRAIEHGFIECETDDSDKARSKTYYWLKMSNPDSWVSTSDTLPSEVDTRVSEVDTQPSEVDTQPSEVDTRTEKETIERNPRKGGAANAARPPEPESVKEAKKRIAQAGIDYEKGGGKKRGVSDPRASASEETLRWARLIATAAARHPIDDGATFDALPAKFRNDCIFNARDVVADLEGGQVTRDAYEKAFAYLANGGGEQYGNGTTPARVTRDAVAFVMNGGKPAVQSPGAMQRYGKQQGIDLDAMERERRDSDKRLAEFRRLKQQLANPPARSIPG
jgi:hypothetical protein